MSLVPSAITVNASGFLTEKGREFLFGVDRNLNPIRFESDGTDNFAITEFSLYDSDINYKSSEKLDSGNLPSPSGKIDEDCVKSSLDIKRKNRILLKESIPSIGFENPFYVIQEGDDVFIKIELSHFIFNSDPKKARIRINPINTNILTENFSVNFVNEQEIIFDENNTEILIRVASIISQKIPFPEFRDIRLDLYDFNNSVSGPFTTTFVRVFGVAIPQVTSPTDPVMTGNTNNGNTSDPNENTTGGNPAGGPITIGSTVGSPDTFIPDCIPPKIINSDFIGISGWTQNGSGSLWFDSMTDSNLNISHIKTSVDPGQCSRVLSQNIILDINRNYTCDLFVIRDTCIIEVVAFDSSGQSTLLYRDSETGSSVDGLVKFNFTTTKNYNKIAITVFGVNNGSVANFELDSISISC